MPTSSTLALLPLVLGTPLWADTSLTLQGTVADGPDHVGQPFALTLVLTDNPAVVFDPVPFDSGAAVYDINYTNEFLSDADLIAGVVGADITGLWSRPDLSEIAPATSVQISNSALRIFIGSDTMEDLGLFFHGRPVGQILLSPGILGEAWSPTPGDFSRAFKGMAGTYSLFDLDISYIWALDGSSAYSLSLDSLTIVPEPSTYGLLLGALALAAAAVRRRR